MESLGGQSFQSHCSLSSKQSDLPRDEEFDNEGHVERNGIFVIPAMMQSTGITTGVPEPANGGLFERYSFSKWPCRELKAEAKPPEGRSEFSSPGASQKGHRLQLVNLNIIQSERPFRVPFLGVRPSGRCLIYFLLIGYRPSESHETCIYLPPVYKTQVAIRREGPLTCRFRESGLLVAAPFRFAPVYFLQKRKKSVRC